MFFSTSGDRRALAATPVFAAHHLPDVGFASRLQSRSILNVERHDFVLKRSVSACLFAEQLRLPANPSL
jgi:hypothetical protein